MSTTAVCSDVCKRATALDVHNISERSRGHWDRHENCPGSTRIPASNGRALVLCDCICHRESS